MGGRNGGEDTRGNRDAGGEADSVVRGGFNEKNDFGSVKRCCGRITTEIKLRRIEDIW